MDYNTSEIRAAARRLTSIANELQSLQSSSVSRISGTARPLKGSTATAIQNQLEDLAEEIQKQKTELNNCANELYDFARRLDIADAKAKALLSAK